MNNYHLPVWLPEPINKQVIPLPPTGERCPLTKLGSGTLHRLIRYGCGTFPVISYKVTGCPKNKKVVFIDYDDLMQSLDSLASDATLQKYVEKIHG